MTNDETAEFTGAPTGLELTSPGPGKVIWPDGTEVSAEQFQDSVTAATIAYEKGLAAGRREAEAALQRVRDLHPKIEDPRHGCCAEPKLCNGHGPECRGPEHPLGGVPWPCATLRAIDGERDHVAEADAIRKQREG